MMTAGAEIIVRRVKILAALLVTVAVTAADMQEAGIQRVAWLQGCWETVSPQRTIEEQWMAPRGRSMVGVGRTVRGDTMVEYELMVVREQAGQLAYEAHPSGQPSATFLSRSVSESNVVFEDLQHDFPQRVGYQRRGADDLLAWIEGMENGRPRRIEFSYRRAACAGR